MRRTCIGSIGSGAATGNRQANAAIRGSSRNAPAKPTATPHSARRIPPRTMDTTTTSGHGAPHAMRSPVCAGLAANAMNPIDSYGSQQKHGPYLQVVPLTANDVGTAFLVLFQLPLKPKPV
jgi:hypothetical protein